MARAIVFAYGNTLRSDDGAGWLVGERLEAKPPDYVDVILTHQLTPDLAAGLEDVSLVVFVDARVAEAPDTDEDVRVEPVTISTSPHDTHRLAPSELLWLADTLFHARPRAYLVTIPAYSLELGETLSERTASLISSAETAVLELVSPGAGGTQTG